MRPAAALLPVLQSRDAHADHARELHLRFAELFPEYFHIDCWKFRHAAGLFLTAANAPGLADTGNKIIKVFLLHSNSSRTKLARSRTCRAVKSSLALFL